MVATRKKSRGGSDEEAPSDRELQVLRDWGQLGWLGRLPELQASRALTAAAAAARRQLRKGNAPCGSRCPPCCSVSGAGAGSAGAWTP